MTVKTDKSINRRITFFSFVLSVFVVYLHAENTDWYSLKEGVTGFASFVKAFEWFISDNVAQAAVPGFFMLSGFLFYKRFDMSLYKNKMTKRVSSLLIPYLCWNVLRLFYAIIIRNVLAAGEERVVFTIDSILSSIFLYKYNQGYWYMFQLILYVVLCPAVYAVIKNKWVGGALIIAFFVYNLIPNIPQDILFILPNSFFFYLLGSYMGRHFEDFVKKEPKHPLLLAGVCFLISQVGRYYFETTELIIFYFIFCLMAVTSLFVLTIKFKNIKMPVWMSYSFFIYSLHGTILEVAQKALFYVLPRNSFCALAEYLILPLVSIVAIIFTALFLSEKMPFVWRVLNGGRQTKKQKKAEESA